MLLNPVRYPCVLWGQARDWGMEIARGPGLSFHSVSVWHTSGFFTARPHPSARPLRSWRRRQALPCLLLVPLFTRLLLVTLVISSAEVAVWCDKIANSFGARVLLSFFLPSAGTCSQESVNCITLPQQSPTKSPSQSNRMGYVMELGTCPYRLPYASNNS